MRFGSFEAKEPNGESTPIWGQAVIRFSFIGLDLSFGWQIEDKAEMVRAVFPARSTQPESRYTVTSDNATERAGNEVRSILKVAATLGTRSTPLGEQVNETEKK